MRSLRQLSRMLLQTHGTITSAGVEVASLPGPCSAQLLESLWRPHAIGRQPVSLRHFASAPRPPPTPAARRQDKAHQKRLADNGLYLVGGQHPTRQQRSPRQQPVAAAPARARRAANLPRQPPPCRRLRWQWAWSG